MNLRTNMSVITRTSDGYGSGPRSRERIDQARDETVSEGSPDYGTDRNMFANPVVPNPALDQCDLLPESAGPQGMGNVSRLETVRVDESPAPGDT